MKKWIALALVTSFAGAALAQTAPATERKPPVAKFSMAMLESGRIDPGYTGVPVEEVINAIEKMTAVKKGEFETTAEYNARSSAALAGKVFGDSHIEDILAFEVRVSRRDSRSSGLRYEFNADTGDVALFVLPSSQKQLPMNGIGAPNEANRRVRNSLDKFDLINRIDSSSTYQGGNAYGATATIAKTNMSRFGIAPNRIPYLNFERDIWYSNPTVASQFKLPTSRAMQELPALKALMLMKLVHPYVAYNFSRVEPKRDDPVDISTQGKYLMGDVIEIVFYSGLTGEIFARLPDKSVSATNVGDESEIEWSMPTIGKLVGEFSESADRKGIDIAGERGQDVLASATGTVVYTGSNLRGYGKLVIIEHNKTYKSAYAHNNQVLVKEGQSVARGQKIAEMGNTDADQVKLHFEIRKSGKPVDPLNYLPR